MMDDDPIDRFLSAIPGMPRPVLDRLVDQMIDRMNVMDGDSDLEDSEGGNHLIDERGNWIGGELSRGPWHEDGEENGDLEGIDEREPEHELHSWGDPPSRAPDGARKSREAHIRRIRATRCVPVMGGEYVLDGTQLRWRSRVAGYRLKKHPLPLRRVPARLRRRKRRR
jgi:hypothetical protein